MQMPDLTPDMLLKAYAVGVFPMAEDRDDPELFWVDPRMRGVIMLDSFHVPRRLRKTLRSGHYQVTFDTDFEAVIEGCAEPTPDRPRTWINDRIITLYTSLFHMGRAHSIECRNEGELIGGLYGVALGGVFFGESMFSRARDASKIALVHLVARLRAGGFSFIDTQFITKHLSRFGAKEIPRNEYRAMLADALRLHADFYHNFSRTDVDALLAG